MSEVLGEVAGGIEPRRVLPRRVAPGSGFRNESGTDSKKLAGRSWVATPETLGGQQIRAFTQPLAGLETSTFCIATDAPLGSHPTKNPAFAGLLKRLKGLEPSTFCMAIGMTSAGIWLIYLQICWFLEFIRPGDGIRIPADWAQSEQVSGTNPERSDRTVRASFASKSGGDGRRDATA